MLRSRQAIDALGDGMGRVVSLQFPLKPPDEFQTLEQEVQFARLILGNTIEECRDPEPGWAPDAVQGRLTQAQTLAWAIEEVDNFRHDLKVTGHDKTLRSVFDRWDGGRDPGNRAFAIRFEEHFRRMQNLSRALNRQLTRPPEDYSHESMLAEEIVNAAFTAALSLEAHYEEGPADEP